MAKQIKVIKCPSCGNNKPTSLGNDRFRCDKCDTEFFLDNDDININVNHNHNTNHANPRPTGSPKAVLWVFGILGSIFFIYILSLVVGAIFSPSTHKNKPKIITTQKVDHPKRKISKYATPCQLISHNGNVYGLYLDENVNGKKGFSFVVYDFKKDSILNIANTGQSKGVKTIHQPFYSTGKDYYLFNNTELWELDPKLLTIKNITDTIANAKPALNSGFKSINFMDQNKGDGLVLETNLGKTFQYFPNVDQLYTSKAFNHFANGGMETVADDAQLRTYYLFTNKESKQSSNIAQLMQIDYKYNNGGPENKPHQINDYISKNLAKYRITSLKPFGKEQIAFSPNVIYSDSTSVVTSYYPTLATDAPLTIELLDKTTETSILKESIERNSNIISVERIGETIYLLTDKDIIYELSKEGK